MNETAVSLIDLLKKSAINDDGEIKRVLKNWSEPQKIALKRELNRNQINSGDSYDADPFQKKTRKILIDVFGIKI